MVYKYKLTDDKGCSNANIRAKHEITGISFNLKATSETTFRSEWRKSHNVSRNNCNAVSNSNKIESINIVP